MRKVLLLAGDYFYTQNGLHECDAHGIAKRVFEDIEIEVADSEFSRVADMLTKDRIARGLF